MVRISIASLIYKSPIMSDWVYESVHEFTPMIKSGEAEFFFVANDPTEKLLSHLKNKGYNYIEQNNPIYLDEELLKMGYAKPEYMHRVYKGYNRAILHSKGAIVVLVNSDNYFSPDWLENLLKYFDTQKIVCSQLVEPKHSKHAVFHSAVNGEFGNNPDNFNKDGFLDFAMRKKRTGISLGGAYMPCMFHKDMGIYAGLYPEGNLAGNSFDNVTMTGDEAFFDRLSKNGILHITSLDSIVYHLKEGEKDDVSELLFEENDGLGNPNNKFDSITYSSLPPIKTNGYQILIQSTLEHSQIIAQLLAKLSEDSSLRPSRLSKILNKMKGIWKKIYDRLRKVYILRLAKRIISSIIKIFKKSD